MIKYKVFLSVAETGNFTKTAEEFGYTQSAVSQIIKSLESEWNIVLFGRTSHGIYPTSDCKSIIPYVKKLCDDYDRIIDKSMAIHNLDGATIRIGAFASVSANFLPIAIKKFKEIYPTVQFKLLQSDYETIKSWINEGRVDFGFLTVDVADNLAVMPFMQDEMVMILPENHPGVKKRKIGLKDFKDEPFIFLDQGKKSEPMEYFLKAGIEPKKEYRVYDDYTIMNMVEQGLGVSILPKLVLYRHHQNIQIRSLTPPIYRNMCVAYRNDDAVSVAAKSFMEFIVKNAGSGEFSL